MPRKKKTEEEKKYDLTININENLLNKIDELVQKNGDKRSRLIERLLVEHVDTKFNEIINTPEFKKFANENCNKKSLLDKAMENNNSTYIEGKSELKELVEKFLKLNNE